MHETGAGAAATGGQYIKTALLAACGAGLGLLLSREASALIGYIWLAVLIGSLAIAWWALKLGNFTELDPPEPEPELPKGPPPLDPRVAESRFLSSASHDLRQPVQAIALFSATLSTHALPEASRKLVEGIETAVEALSDQMETVFSIAKADAGRIEAHLKPVRLGDVLSSSTAARLEEAHQAGLHLRHVDTRCSVLADEAMLTRCVDTMLDHALQVTGSGGIVVGCRRSGASILIDVCDSSPGIEPDFLPSIFEVGNVHGARLPDHGLALILASRLARLMGGSLHVASNPGKGNRLRLQLARA